MTNNKQSVLVRAIPLFLVIFIDGAGLGLVFPILNALLVDPHVSFLPFSTSHTMRNFLYGLTTSIFMFCWFFGAAIISDVSDIIGRKRALFICLVGSFLGYLLSGIAIYCHSLTLLILGRVVAGFTAGSQPVAQASIIDICPANKKATYLGYTLLAVSLGFIIGPIIGGVFSDKHIVSWFNFSLPMYIASILSFGNIFLLLGLYKETFTITKKMKIHLSLAVNLFVSAFRDKVVRHLSLTFFFFLLGWANFYTYISLYSLRSFHFSALNTTLLMAIMGLGFAVGMGYLAKLFDQHIDHRIGILTSLISTAALSAVIYFSHSAWVLWILTAPTAAMASIAYVLLLTVFSNQVDDTRQGWVMGITGAIMAFCFGVVGLISTLYAHFSGGFPILVAAVITVIAVILMCMQKV